MKVRSRKTKTISAILGFAMFASLGAWAAWLLNNQQGIFDAEIGNLQNIVITGAQVPTTDELFPGGPPGSAVATVNNPNSQTLYVIAVTSGFDSFQGNMGNPPCSGNSVMPINRSDLHIAVAPGVQQVELPDIVQLSSSAASGCQGLTVHLLSNLTLSTE